MCVRHVIRFHLLNTLGIRNRDEHVFSRHPESLAKNAFQVRDMFEYFKDQDRVERPVPKRKNRIDIRHWKTAIGSLPEIFEVDIATATVHAFLHQCTAVSPKTATKVEHC